MTRIFATLLPVILCSGIASAQSSQRTVQASGNATIYVNPDQAQLDAGVITNAQTAQDAVQQNATMTTAVLTAIKAVLGSTGTVQTVSYSANPRYSNGSGQTSIIVGYTVSNTVRVTTSDLSI